MDEWMNGGSEGLWIWHIFEFAFFFSSFSF